MKFEPSYFLSFAVIFIFLYNYLLSVQYRAYYKEFQSKIASNTQDNITQSDVELVDFLRDYYMRINPKPEEINANDYLKLTKQHEQVLEMAQYVSNLMGSKLNGAYIQSMTGSRGSLLTGPWLSETLRWDGVIIEPDTRRYFSLKKQNAYLSKIQVINSCVSSNGQAREIMVSRLDGDDTYDSQTKSWSKVLCFPIYTVMLATYKVKYDLMSLGVDGEELDILRTIPFDKVDINVISIHLSESLGNFHKYAQSIYEFLRSKSYRLKKTIGFNYFYVKDKSHFNSIVLGKLGFNDRT